MIRIGPRPEDFVVEEIPLYPTSGQGDHVYVTLEKRGVGTPEAVRALAGALGVRVEDVGVAGRKDKNAVTRQTLSLPPPVTPEQALAVEIPGLRVLAATRHGNKLRTGHLAGNRFAIRLEGQLDRAAIGARLAALAEPPGMPNFYGSQRFGVAGDNADRGRECVLGTRRARGGELRFLVSALQASLFNAYAELRQATEDLAACIQGDIMRTARGGLFASEDPAADGARMRSGEIVPTGPMFGHAMRRPAPGTLAATREDEVLAQAGLTLGDFARPWIKRIAEGTRRALTVRVGEPALEGDVVRFSLPPGSFATVCVAEILGLPFRSAMLRAPSELEEPQELDGDSA